MSTREEEERERERERERTYQNEISKLLHLHRGLEGELKLTSLDDDVGEIEQMDLERIEHTLPGNDDLLGLFLDGKGPNESGDFLGGLPLRELSETLLTSPD